MSNIRFSDVLIVEPRRPVKTVTSGAALTGTGSVSLLNLSGIRGILRSLGWRTASTISGSPVINLDITIDGGTTMSLSIFNAGLTLQADIAAYTAFLSGAITSSGSFMMLDFGAIPFNVSCVVALNKTTGAGGGTADLTAIHEVPIS